MDLEFIQKLVKTNNSKIVMLVLDGVGGLPKEPDGLTELETAITPNLDKIAKEGICGLQIPVRSAITPGSGPGHLGIFGFDPVKYKVGRGVLAAMGTGFDLRPDDVALRGNFCTLDVALRGNFCTLDENGNVTDRRAGRIPTEKNEELCKLLSEKISIPGVEVFIKPVKEYRLLIVFRANGLGGNLIDTDPQEIGKKPFEPKATDPDSENTVGIVKDFLKQAKEVLKDERPANMILTRGYSKKPDWKKPDWPLFPNAFGLKSAAIAAYPMYKGLAGLIGMELIGEGETITDEFNTLEENWDKFDYFFIHIKKTDSNGEDGNFDKKVSIIEEVDKHIPRIMSLNPDVVIVTGDHSTPAAMKSHSWHPVPLIIWSKYCRPDNVDKFGERNCITGGLGPRLPATDIIPLALANAKRLEKYGA